jgi:hypothetical protein
MNETPIRTRLCGDAKATLARIEASEMDRRRALAHQQTCSYCMGDLSLDAMLRTLTENDNPAATARVQAQLAAKRPRPTAAIVVLLAIASALQAAVALPWLVGANPFRNVLGAASSAHLTRDGALGVVIAVAGFVVAWRPRYAFAMLGLVAATVSMQVLGGFVDAPEHHSGVPFEFVHALAGAIGLLIVLVALLRDRGFGPLQAKR